MMRKTILYTLAAVLAMGLSGCGKWLDVKPYDKISEEELLSSEAGFEKFLNGIYIELNSELLYGGAMTVEMLEIMGGAYEIGDDNSVWGNYSDLAAFRYGTEYWRNRLDQTWNKAYSLVLNCNLLLDNLEKKQEVFKEENHAGMIRGEALALRAFLQFDMLRLFGPVFSRDSKAPGIPYYKTCKMVPEPLLPADEVVEAVRTDLTEARILLDADPIRTDGGLKAPSKTGSERFWAYRSLRLNYYAVTALLARLELYAGNRTAALRHAKEVIAAVDDGVFAFVDKSQVTGSPENPDRVFSSEVIFSLTHATRNSLFRKYYDPSRLPNFVFRMNNELMNRLIYGGGAVTGGSQDDYRYRVNWQATGANRYFYKYSDLKDAGNIRNTMIPLIRLGEMYLIAAEAQSEDLSAGLPYVNLLRKRRGVAGLNALDGNTLRYEYVRELYGEGQLFFMYKRMFAPILFSADAKKNPEPADHIFVVPLPDAETEN